MQVEQQADSRRGGGRKTADRPHVGREGGRDDIHDDGSKDKDAEPEGGGGTKDGKQA